MGVRCVVCLRRCRRLSGIRIRRSGKPNPTARMLQPRLQQFLVAVPGIGCVSHSSTYRLIGHSWGMAAAAAAAGTQKAMGGPPPVVSAVLSAAGQGSVLGGEEEEEGCLAPCGPPERACGSGDEQWQGGLQGDSVIHAPSGDPAAAASGEPDASASGEPAAATTATSGVSMHLRMEVGSGRVMRWMVRLFVLVIMGTIAWTIYYVVVTRQVRATPNHLNTQPPNHSTPQPPHLRTPQPPHHCTAQPPHRPATQLPNRPTSSPARRPTPSLPGARNPPPHASSSALSPRPSP